MYAAYSTGRDRCPLSGAQRRPLGCFSEVCNALAEQYFQSVIFFCPLYGGCPLLGGSVMRGSTVYLFALFTKTLLSPFLSLPHPSLSFPTSLSVYSVSQTS